MARGTPETLEKLRALHPSEEPATALNGVQLAAPPKIGSGFSRTTECSSFYRTVLHDLPRFSAPGVSGWTYELVQLCWSEVESFPEALMMIVRGIVSGTMPLRSWWLACRLIALDKGGGKVRPIAVSDCIYRLAARALMATLDLEELIPSWQLGVKSRGGCEPAVHLIRARLAAGWKVVQIDWSNAFNSISRAALFDTLRGRSAARKMMRMVRYAYAVPSKLFTTMDDGSLSTLSSSSGVRQGDPLAMLMFAVFLEPVMREAGLPEDIQTIAIVDDVSLMIPPGSASFDNQDQILERLAARALQGGLRLNLDKCVTLLQADLDQESTAVRVLGAYLGDSAAFVGGDGACEGAVGAVADKWLDRLRAIDALPRQIGLLLLRSSVVAGMVHLCRMMPPSQMAAAAARLDEGVQDLVLGWVGALNSEGAVADGLDPS
ncbi:MAG: reverse transcriptase domain-containing protein, partial [Candidatus Poseidoniia archaeon]